MTDYKQVRPSWCPHPTCIFQRRVTDALCGGKLAGEVEEKDEFGELHINDLRICMNETAQPPPHAKVIDFKVNASDLDWFRFVYDALDGKRTSWLSRRGEASGVESALTKLRNVHADAIELQGKLKGTKHEKLEELVMGIVVELGYAINSLTETKRIMKPPDQKPT